jgi:hypothetical protein
MDSIPTWLGAIGALFVIAAALGAAVAVYRTNLQGTALTMAERTIERLRGEVTDYERREEQLEHRLEIQAVENRACSERCTVLEDLILKRKDDDVIRSEIAAVRATVDENVMAQLTTILDLLSKNGNAHA